MWRDDVTDDAAALTYYAVLAVLPALLVTVITLGLVSPATAQTFIVHVTVYAPGSSGSQLHDVLTGMLRTDSVTWGLLFGAAGSALWSASSYLAVFRRALHRMHGARDQRSGWRTAPRIVLTAAALLGLLLLSSLVLVLTGTAAESTGRLLGADATAAWTWSLLRWPLLLLLVTVLVIVVFRTGPEPARRRAFSVPGGALAAVLWLAASIGFALYTSAMGAYSALYGSLAGVVVFLVWLWLSNLALLAGAQFSAELAARHPPHRSADTAAPATVRQRTTRPAR
ncbi:YihY/virulence factor BrkB family protein [Kitasatospora sp. NPDC093679]|uniref:YihY/virulence factor BrkB family protein n=1 Tax=Kitasatospora sp. NPDC093679 TaxID=3154983 RepID=UPI0034364BDF